MKLRSLVLIAATASVVLVVPAAFGRPQTTEPDVYDVVNVTLTDSQIVLSDHSSERGNGVDFKVINKGKRAHSFALLADTAAIISLDRQGLHTPILRPGQSSVLSVYMDQRGIFTYRSLAATDRAKAGMHGKYTVT